MVAKAKTSCKITNLKTNGPKHDCDAKSSTVLPSSDCLSSSGISQQGPYQMLFYPTILLISMR